MAKGHAWAVKRNIKKAHVNGKANKVCVSYRVVKDCWNIMNWLRMQGHVFLKFHFDELSRVLFSVIGLVVDPSSTYGIKASLKMWSGFLLFSDRYIQYKQVPNQRKTLNKWETLKGNASIQGVCKWFDKNKNDVNQSCGQISTPLNTNGMCKADSPHHQMRKYLF